MVRSGLLLVLALLVSMLVGCGDSGKGGGDTCVSNDECESKVCQSQTDGAKRCTQPPDTGGW